MQGRFTGVRQCRIHIGAALNQELTESPVPVKAGSVKIEVLLQGPGTLHWQAETGSHLRRRNRHTTESAERPAQMQSRPRLPQRTQTPDRFAHPQCAPASQQGNPSRLPKTYLPSRDREGAGLRPFPPAKRPLRFAQSAKRAARSPSDSHQYVLNGATYRGAQAANPSLQLLSDASRHHPPPAHCPCAASSHTAGLQHNHSVVDPRGNGKPRPGAHHHHGRQQRRRANKDVSQIAQPKRAPLTDAAATQQYLRSDVLITSQTGWNPYRR